MVLNMKTSAGQMLRSAQCESWISTDGADDALSSYDHGGKGHSYHGPERDLNTQTKDRGRRRNECQEKPTQ